MRTHPVGLARKRTHAVPRAGARVVDSDDEEVLALGDDAAAPEAAAETDADALWAEMNGSAKPATATATATAALAPPSAAVTSAVGASATPAAPSSVPDRSSKVR